MRIALIDTTGTGDESATNRFAGLAHLLRAQGHAAILVDGLTPRLDDEGPVFTGYNRAVATAPMVAAHSLARSLAEAPPDLVIAPLRGGIAQSILMARACGEAFARTRVALWCNTPSRTLFLAEDGLETGLAPLIADALERQALSCADALIMPRGVPAEIGALVGDRSVPTYEATLPSLRREARSDPSAPEDIKEIVFAGKMIRRAGLVEFIEAVVKLSKDGLMAGRIVTFLGTMPPSQQGLSPEWLGVKASTWTFPFQVLDLSDQMERQRYLDDPGRLAVVVTDDADELVGLDERHVALLREPAGRRSLLARLERALAAALGNGSPGEASAKLEPSTLDWSALVADLASLPLPGLPRPALQTGATVCILHYNRLEYLAEAIASIPDEVDGQPVEVLVVDNGSVVPDVESEIRKIAGPRPSLRVLCLVNPMPPAEALNRGVLEAKYETVLFLDDDNQFAPAGVQRLARALSNHDLDIVVTALDVFEDGVPQPAPSVGRLIFLGAAHSAGLFFNAFGDTAMAVRRDSFRRAGGFLEVGYRYPSLDWIALARAQAKGLRIGALQWPAVRYRRNTTRTEVSGIKLDVEGARALVFEAYGEKLDAKLLARYAQKLQLDET